VSRGIGQPVSAIQTPNWSLGDTRSRENTIFPKKNFPRLEADFQTPETAESLRV